MRKLTLKKQIEIIFEFELLALKRDKATLWKILVIEPLGYLLFLGIGLSTIISEINYYKTVISYKDYVTSGVCCLFFLKIFTQVIYRMVMEQRWGLLALKRSSGINSLSYIIGFSILLNLLFIFQAVICFTFGNLSGATFQLKQIILFLLQLWPIIIFWICLAINIVSLIKSYAMRDLIISLLILPLTFTAPVFYTLNHIPFYLDFISSINPLTLHLKIARAILFKNDYFNLYLIMLFITLITFLLAIYNLNRAQVISKET